VTEPQPLAGPPEGTAPVCYRHPDRETYIRCARCDKPICPDCMVSAAVGFQCPDCVAEGRRTQRPVRTVVGGAVHARSDLITTALIGSCVVTFALQVLIPSFTSRFWMQGVEVAAGQWYRLVTAGFLHVSVIHIGFNMWALWVVGRPLEAMLGRVRFVALYFVSLLAGSATSYLFGSPVTPSLGASGAIFGLFGGMIVVARRMHWNLGGLVTIVAINLALPFFSSGIDWHAHVGGLVAGAAATAAMVYAPPSVRVAASVGACVLLVAVSVVLVGVRTQQICNDPTYAGVCAPGAVLPGQNFRPTLE
jgi:membrane associated rhomboid family serine protease